MSLSVFDVMWYGYNRGRTNDTDWGCLYRSVQNVCQGLGLRVPSINELLRIANRVAPQWGEPAMFADFFRRKKGFLTQAFVLNDPSCLKFTHTTQYKLVTKLPRGFWEPQAAYVVDDGTSAYAVVPWAGKLWWIDPHVVYPTTPVAEMFRFKKHMATAAAAGRCWMILKVQPV